MKGLNRFIAVIPIAISLVVPCRLVAATQQEKINFAYSIGMAAGRQYCAKKPAKESVEKGTAIAMAETDISMTAIKEMNFSESIYAVPMVEGMFDYSIDHCPERAKQLFRDISESM